MEPVAKMKGEKLKSIDELARLAGVAKSTVSRALNDSPLVGASTRERILALAAEHGFTPSAVARNLSRRSSRTIAFVTHAYDPGECCGISDPFSLEIMGGIAMGLHDLGYDLLVVHIAPHDRNWAAAYLDSGKVDGFILMTSNQKRGHLEALLALGAPFVAWGPPGKAGDYCTVSGEDRKGGFLACEHLLGLGRRRIGVIAGPRVETECQQRLQGTREAMAARGLVLDESLVIHGDYGERSAAKAMEELLIREPGLDGLVCQSDLMALSAQRVLAARGIRVPQGLAVVGYDNLSMASYATPSLTTISQNIGLAGRFLARDLVAFIERGVVTHTSMPVELVRRDSA